MVVTSLISFLPSFFGKPRRWEQARARSSVNLAEGGKRGEGGRRREDASKQGRKKGRKEGTPGVK
jgi:hypothetical protein